MDTNPKTEGKCSEGVHYFYPFLEEFILCARCGARLYPDTNTIRLPRVRGQAKSDESVAA